MASGTDLEVFLEGTMTGLALLLAVVAAASYARVRSRRALGLAAAFALFFVKGVLLLTGTIEQAVVNAALDLGVLALLYVAVMTG